MMFVHMPSILESPKHGVESSHSSYTVESNALVVKPKLPRRGYSYCSKTTKKEASHLSRYYVSTEYK